MTDIPAPTSVPFSWDDLARYEAERRFLDGYPEDQRTFFAPRDDVHGLLVALLGSAQHSIVVNMYGYDDDELNRIIQGKLAAEHVYVQMSLDLSQAGGLHEREILARWANDSFGNSIAIGTSSRHNAISHLKIVIVDGVYTVKGSTNWSLSGERRRTTRSRSAAAPSWRRRRGRSSTSTTTSCSSRWSGPSSTSPSCWPATGPVSPRRRRPPNPGRAPEPSHRQATTCPRIGHPVLSCTSPGSTSRGESGSPPGWPCSTPTHACSTSPPCAPTTRSPRGWRRTWPGRAWWASTRPSS